MNSRNLIMAGSMAVLISSIAACGGSDSVTASSTSTSRIVNGPITAFGSVYVNGDRYKTDSATVYVEDSEGSESDLRVGMMVSVEVSADGSASAIHFDDDLEGVVVSNTVATDGTGTMNVMGQIVTVTSDTIFESKISTIAAVSNITAGNIVEVSGYATGQGAITATRIEVKAETLAAYLAEHAEGVELKGVVASQNAAAQTFMIGAQLISYAGAVLDDMPAGSWDGLYVEVKSQQAIVDGQLVASKVELEDGGSKGHGDEGDETEVHGTVSEVSDSAVTVNGQTFLLDANTEYEHGSLADLIAGVTVEVEGYKNDGGQLVAREIEFDEHEAGESIEFKAAVSNIASTDINVGQITLASGEIILIGNDTIMHDDRDDAGVIPEMHFNLSKLAIGDFVEVHVINNGDGTYTAVKLEREDTL